jgi:hypothetical protein
MKEVGEFVSEVYARGAWPAERRNDEVLPRA